jgi:ABC-type antimicrobial peptide transport system permease subunit
MAPLLRREIPRVTAGYRVRNIETQTSLVRRQLVREKLLATLSLFFAIVALVLAAVGLYGVLNYSTLQRRREIGIHMALGAHPAHVVRRVTVGMLATVLLGVAVGLAGGLACGGFVETLLFGVKATDAGMLAIPVLMLLGIAVAASIPPAVRAVRLDPSQVLRSE